MYNNAQPTVAKLGAGRSAAGDGGVSSAKATNGEGVVCADHVVGALLPVCGQVAIG